MVTKPFAITLDVGTSLANRTGTWRTMKPVYVNRQPPCNAKCPAGEKCQAWLFHAESGDYEGAWRQIVEDNPFPACMGRVCYHTCESACNRGELDESVGINAVERFLGDHAIERGGASRSRRRVRASVSSLWARGPAGVVLRVPPCSTRSRRACRRRCSAGGRHHALWHSEVSSAA